VTLKTGVMAALHHRNKSYFKVYSNGEPIVIIFHDLTVFFCIFDKCKLDEHNSIIIHYYYTKKTYISQFPQKC